MSPSPSSRPLKDARGSTSPTSSSRRSSSGEDGRRVLGPRRHRAWAEAASSYFAGDFARAADRYEEIGSLSDEAEARLRAAKSLMASGNGAEGEIQLERALGFYRPVGATRFIREGEALLAAAS